MERATISFERRRGEILFDPDKVSETELLNRIKKAGFKAKVIEK